MLLRADGIEEEQRMPWYLFSSHFLVAMEHVGGNSDLQKLFEMGNLEEMLLKVSSATELWLLFGQKHGWTKFNDSECHNVKHHHLQAKRSLISCRYVRIFILVDQKMQEVMECSLPWKRKKFECLAWQTNKTISSDGMKMPIAMFHLTSCGIIFGQKIV